MNDKSSQSVMSRKAICTWKQLNRQSGTRWRVKEERGLQCDEGVSNASKIAETTVK